MTYVFVVYNHIEGLLTNLNRLYSVRNDVKVVVVDNSDANQAQVLSDVLRKEYPTVQYIQSDSNDRIHAYNIGFSQVETEWVCFRTDDDLFYELTAQSLVEAHEHADIISGCHSYNHGPVECVGPNRPLESFIFRTDVLRKHFPMQPGASADWRLLKALYEDEAIEITHSTEKILDKVPHGRPS